MPTPVNKVAPSHDKRKGAPGSRLIERRLWDQVSRVVALCRASQESFFEFESVLRPEILALGRLALALFLAVRHERLVWPTSELREGTRYETRGLQSRLMGTFFGKVRYWRTYLCALGGGAGYCPLDKALGLPESGFSTDLVGLMARVATKMSYAQTRMILGCFLGWSPSTTTVEQAVLGLGRYSQDWFEAAPAPEEDGEVLIIQIDGKSPPTATESELEKRRGERREPLVSASPRHRGRAQRKARGPKPRRKAGDKSKNGRMTTVVVMYTLKRGRDKNGNSVLKGPLNKRVYASFAAKRHAFAIARREADKRGFTEQSGKTIQLVTDGDNDYARYAKEFFPGAIHTLDVMHATEYLWTAGRSLHREGSKALQAWANRQRQRLYAGEVEEVIAELRDELAKIPKSGPGNKGKRKRLSNTINYFAKRIHMMNYDVLIARDLEIGSGAVEGAVRYVVSQRFDAAGMRWIRERAEALLQLRCIEINGDWDAFLRFVHSTGTEADDNPVTRLSLRATTPAPLSTFGLAA